MKENSMALPSQSKNGGRYMLAHGVCMSMQYKYTCIEGIPDTLGWLRPCEKDGTCTTRTLMLSGLIFPGVKIRYKGLLIVYNRDQCKGAGKSIDACAKLK